MEQKKDIKIEDKRSILTLDSRKKITLNGVVEVMSFNDEQIVLNTILGVLTIRGKNLKMNKLDVQNGDMTIIGQVNSLVYTGMNKKADKESILKKMFK